MMTNVDQHQRFNPAMVTLARESRGVKQSELASSLQISKGTMSKIESGILEPSAELLKSVADSLHYPLDFFYSPFQPFPAGLPFYRKHKTLPAKEQSVLVAEMNVYRKVIDELLKDLEVESEPIPNCDVDEYGDAETIAMAIRQYLRLPRGPIKNLTALLESIGLIVVLLDVPTHRFSGASMYLENGSYVLFANANMPSDRLRFTLAHELGHVVMHRLPTPNVEDEANRFAAELLMPSTDIAHQLGNVDIPQLANLKRFFGTSMAAILRRSLDLNKIPKRHYEYIWTQMGRLGYRTREPEELNWPRETPTLLQEMVRMYLEEFGYSPDELSHRIQLYERELVEKFHLSSTKPSLRLV